MKRFAPFFAVVVLAAVCSGCPTRQRPSGSAPAVRPVYEAPVVSERAYSLTPPVVNPLPATPAWQPVSGRVVILDAGHGGDDLGAAYFGVREKDVNLALVQRAAAILRARGVAVQLTRPNDVFIPLPQRSDFANKNPRAVFVSIHCNASGRNPQAQGVETFILSQQFSDDEQCRRALARYSVTGKDKGSSRQELERLTRVCRAEGPVLAASMQRALTVRLAEPDRGIKPGNLAVLRETFFCPAVLVEVGFVSHYPTARKMTSGAWRDLTAHAIADGIIDYLRKGY